MPRAADSLAALRDIHLPEAVSLWPLAPGWWVLLALLAACIAAGAIGWRRRRRSARRAALLLLAEVEDSFRTDGDTRRLAVSLSSLLRRVALLRFPRRDVASLHGEGWTSFLRAGANRVGFPADVARALEERLYQPAHPDRPARLGDRAAADAWIAAAGAWIRRVA